MASNLRSSDFRFIKSSELLNFSSTVTYTYEYDSTTGPYF